jgi:hypothetical protein
MTTIYLNSDAMEKLHNDGEVTIKGGYTIKYNKLEEGKPGLWDNIHAKKERGEKPSHGNSDDYKSAVKAGKKINKMKKSELKEYLKNEVLRMSEATSKEVDTQKELNKELEITKKLTSTMEGKMKKSEFKEYLKTEILAEFNGNIDPGTEPKSFLKKKPDYVQLEEEEEIEDIEVDVTDDVEIEDEVVVEPTPDEATLDGMTDELVAIARRAKEAGFVELANQILNSAKFSSKTQFDAITPEV